MLASYGILVSSLLGFISSADTSPVKLQCVKGCLNNTVGITAHVGVNLTLRYIVEDKVCVFEVKYNGNPIVTTYEPHLCRLDVRAVTGRDPRLLFRSDLRRVRKNFVYEFQLLNLSISQDNGSVFEYLTDLKDGNGDNVNGIDIVKVLEPAKVITPLIPTTEPINLTGDNSTAIPVSEKKSTLSTSTDTPPGNTISDITPLPGIKPISSFNVTVNETTNIQSPVEATIEDDKYPWLVVFAIVFGAVAIVILVIVVLVVMRLRQLRRSKYQYESGEEERLESTAEDEFTVAKAKNAKSNGNGDYQVVYAEVEHGEPGQPQLVYAKLEIDDDTTCYASLNNQSNHTVANEDSSKDTQDADAQLPDPPLPHDTQETPKYVNVVKNKPPSDRIEPPSDYLADVQVHT